ncbi:hypothetical protein [Kordia jejudonensis]|uniref:hypothetical protein n=1 Tax=Kordia jejudonensis TaxID=1348245 RepID=UPI000629C0F8|nr:hypothetical protein [Kordia jejudonensis]
MKTLLKLAFLLLPICLFAQENEVFERLHSKDLEQSLYISFDGTNFFYKSELSNPEKPFIKLTKGITRNFQIGNDDENTLQLFIQFYNPLTHQIKATTTESDDENFKALANFMENLSTNVGDFAEVSSISTKSDLPVIPELPQGLKKSKMSEAFLSLLLMIDEIVKVNEDDDKIDKTLDQMYESSPFMYNWIVKFKKGIKNTEDDSKIFTDPLYTKKFQDVVTTINGMKQVEDFLFRKLDEYNKNVPELIKAAHDDLRNVSVNDLKSFKEKLKDSKAKEAKLTKQLQTAKKNFSNIKNLLKEQEVAVTSFFNDDDEETEFKSEFHDLNNSTIGYLEAILGDKMQAHGTAIAKLKELNDKLTKYCEAYENNKYPTGYKLLEEDAFGFQYEKKRTYEIVGVKLNASGDEVATSKIANKFVVRKSQGRLAIFTSIGVFYTPFEYKNYGLLEGLVAETQGDPVYVRPAFYLNFLYRLKEGDIFYPMFQVGITQGIKTPMFPIGVGFTIRDKFSVTAGPLLAFQRELNTLEIGAMADDATLQDDLESRIRASFYISINFRL